MRLSTLSLSAILVGVACCALALPTEEQAVRRKRMPYLSPQAISRYYGWDPREDAFERELEEEDEEEDDDDEDEDLGPYDEAEDPSSRQSIAGFARQRRGGLRLLPSHKFNRWRALVDSAGSSVPGRSYGRYDAGDELERKRRIPYFYPKYNYGYLQRLEDEDEEDKRKKRVIAVRKRGNPYFYPSLNSGKWGAEYKRVFPWRKRSLSDTLDNDDPSAFGYDKRDMRRKREDDDDDDDEEKRRRKRGGDDEDKRKKRVFRKRSDDDEDDDKRRKRMFKKRSL